MTTKPSDLVDLTALREWAVMAFRAMNDANTVLATLEPESTDESVQLAQLRAWIGGLCRTLPVLLGLTTADVAGDSVPPELVGRLAMVSAAMSELFTRLTYGLSTEDADNVLGGMSGAVAGLLAVTVGEQERNARMVALGRYYEDIERRRQAGVVRGH